MEKVGTKLSDILCKKDPWEDQPCGRPECFPCGTEGQEGKFRRETVVYTISCKGCSLDGTSAEYTGESSRTMFCRGREHLEALKGMKDDSPLWKHCLNTHNGEIQKFEMKLLRCHKSAFERQIHEAVYIQMGHRDITLNSKSEWNGDRIPRIVLEVKDQVEQKDYNGQKLELPGAKRSQAQETKAYQTSNKKRKTIQTESAAASEKASTDQESCQQVIPPTTTTMPTPAVKVMELPDQTIV